MEKELAKIEFVDREWVEREFVKIELVDREYVERNWESCGLEIGGER